MHCIISFFGCYTRDNNDYLSNFDLLSVIDDKNTNPTPIKNIYSIIYTSGRLITDFLYF